jgi:phosphonate transport system substrate-binding protein
MRSANRIILLIWICFAQITLLNGCSDSEEIISEPDSSKEESPLNIGLIPERNLFRQIEHYEPLANYLSKKLGRKIELKMLTRYGNIIDNFISLQLDAAFFGSFVYTLAHAKLGVEVFARPEDYSGISAYHGLIFVRKDSGIAGIKDMKGKTFAMVDKATTAGYIFPLAFFKRNGVTDYKQFLKETYFAGTHEDVIHDVLNKKADIGAAKNTVYFQLATENKRIIQDLLILETSLDVPENGIAFRKDLGDPIKDELKQLFLNMHNDPEGIKVLKALGARVFIETTDSDYSNVHILVQEIGLNLKTYDYIND